MPTPTPLEPENKNENIELDEILAADRFLSSAKSRIVASAVCAALALALALAWGGKQITAWLLIGIVAGASILGLLLGERITFVLVGIVIGSVTTYFYLQS